MTDAVKGRNTVSTRKAFSIVENDPDCADRYDDERDDERDDDDDVRTGHRDADDDDNDDEAQEDDDDDDQFKAVEIPQC